MPASYSKFAREHAMNANDVFQEHQK